MNTLALYCMPVIIGSCCRGVPPARDNRYDRVDFRLNNKPIRVLWTHPSSLDAQDFYDCAPRGSPEHALAPAVMFELRAELMRHGLTLERFDLVDSTKGDGLTPAIQPGVISAALDLRTERGVMVVSKMGTPSGRMPPRSGRSKTEAPTRVGIEELDAAYYCLDVSGIGDAILIKIDLFRGIL